MTNPRPNPLPLAEEGESSLRCTKALPPPRAGEGWGGGDPGSVSEDEGR
jgi:hypothetical protein